MSEITYKKLKKVTDSPLCKAIYGCKLIPLDIRLKCLAEIAKTPSGVNRLSTKNVNYGLIWRYMPSGGDFWSAIFDSVNGGRAFAD